MIYSHTTELEDPAAGAWAVLSRLTCTLWCNGWERYDLV